MTLSHAALAFLTFAQPPADLPALPVRTPVPLAFDDAGLPPAALPVVTGRRVVRQPAAEPPLVRGQPPTSFGRPQPPDTSAVRLTQPPMPFGRPTPSSDPYGRPAPLPDPYGRPAPSSGVYGRQTLPTGTYDRPTGMPDPYGRPAWRYTRDRFGRLVRLPAPPAAPRPTKIPALRDRTEPPTTADDTLATTFAGLVLPIDKVGTRPAEPAAPETIPEPRRFAPLRDLGRFLRRKLVGEQPKPVPPPEVEHVPPLPAAEHEFKLRALRYVADTESGLSDALVRSLLTATSDPSPRVRLETLTLLHARCLDTRPADDPRRADACARIVARLDSLLLGRTAAGDLREQDPRVRALAVAIVILCLP